MERNPDTYNIKLSGKMNIPEQLEIGKDYHIALEGSITSVTKKNNEDGTYTLDYKLEPLKFELLRSNGTTMKADKSKLSQKLRGRAFIHEGENNTDNMYEWFVTKSIRHFDEIVDYVKKLETEN